MTIEDTNRTYAKQKAKVKYIHSLEAINMSMAGKTDDKSYFILGKKHQNFGCNDSVCFFKRTHFLPSDSVCRLLFSPFVHGNVVFLLSPGPSKGKIVLKIEGSKITPALPVTA